MNVFKELISDPKAEISTQTIPMFENGLPSKDASEVISIPFFCVELGTIGKVDMDEELAMRDWYLSQMKVFKEYLNDDDATVVAYEREFQVCYDNKAPITFDFPAVIVFSDDKYRELEENFETIAMLAWKLSEVPEHRKPPEALVNSWDNIADYLIESIEDTDRVAPVMLVSTDGYLLHIDETNHLNILTAIEAH